MLETPGEPMGPQTATTRPETSAPAPIVRTGSSSAGLPPARGASVIGVVTATDCATDSRVGCHAVLEFSRPRAPSNATLFTGVVTRSTSRRRSSCRTSSSVCTTPTTRTPARSHPDSKCGVIVIPRSRMASAAGWPLESLKDSTETSSQTTTRSFWSSACATSDARYGSHATVAEFVRILMMRDCGGEAQRLFHRVFGPRGSR